MFKNLLISIFAVAASIATSISSFGQPPAWYGKPAPIPAEIQVATPSPTIGAVAKPTTAAPPRQKQIDCMGPDGKHFQTSQQECDTFKNAWGHGQTQKVIPAYKQQVPPNNPSEITIPCSTVVGMNIAFGSSLTAAYQNCSDLQAKAIHDKAQIDSLGQQPSAEYTPSQPVDNSAARNTCISQAAQKEQLSITNIMGTYGQSPESDVLITQAQGRYNNDVTTCYQLYP